jgi:acyl carrier protein
MHESKPALDAAASTPRQNVEQTVARIWAEILGLDHVGLHDNFLLLGGESLLATQVVSEIRARLGCDIPIRSIFVSTVAQIAAEIAERNTGGEPHADQRVEQACVAALA